MAADERKQSARVAAMKRNAMDALFVGLAGANAVLGVSFVAAMCRHGAPFVPTARRKISAIFAPGGLLARARALRPDRGGGAARGHLVDLGSGEGSIVRAACREGGFRRATGYEINPALLALARLRSLGSGGAERHRLQSLWSAPLDGVDVCVVYGMPPIMARLGAKLRAELPDGALVVSNGYELPLLGRPIVAEVVETGAMTPDVSGPVYVYVVAPRTA
jgi:hypothetical protein